MKSPGFTIVAIIALALGLGVNTMVFAIYNGALIKSLPFDNPQQVVQIRNRNVTEGYRFPISYPDFQEYRQQSKSFAVLAVATQTSVNLSDNGGFAEALTAARVTANAFSLIGQKPVLGRDFAGADETPGADAVAILSYALWQTRYGADQAIVGKTIRINGRIHTVIGVMREGIRFPENAMLWVPLNPTPRDRANRRLTNLPLMGRLRDGISIEQAQSELTVIAKRLSASYPETNKDVEPIVIPYIEAVMDAEERQVLQTLIGAVTFVLLIACANVANLLLSRAVFRSRETSIRTALGASRWRIIRQLLIESVLLSLLGGVAGLLLAYAGIRIFEAAVVQIGLPYFMTFSMDATVFAYLFAVCFITGVLFGLAPALQISKVNVNDGLREGGRGSSDGMKSRRLTTALVIAEISLTLVLMVGGGLMIRSFLKMQVIDVGFQTQDLLTMRLRLTDAKYPQPADRVAFEERLREKLSSLPGVDSFATASNLPMGATWWSFRLADRDVTDKNGRLPDVPGVVISPGYFQALDLTMRRGREFVPGDGSTGAEAVIVNERFAAQYWPGEDPLGKRLAFDEDGPWMTVVGVSVPIRQTVPDSAQDGIEPTVYVPYRLQPFMGFNIVVRSHVSRESITRTLRDELRNLDPDVPLFDVQTIQGLLDRNNAGRRILSTLFSVFAVVALVLSTVGIYAVTSYSVSQRTQEIGVRMALGASSRDILWLVLRQGLRQLAVGLPLGLLGAYGLSRLIANQLFQVTPSDPATFLSITLMLIAVVVFACVVPARRAARLNSVEALRT